MLPQPFRFAALILAFAPLFIHRSWRHARRLLIGTILTVVRRSVTSVLRIMGCAHERRFANAHRILLGLLFAAFAPRGPFLMALDDTTERHRGKPLPPDDRWDEIAPLLPSPRPRPQRGRPPIENRAALTGILFVLRSGIPYGSD